MPRNMKQVYAIQKKNKERLLQVNPKLDDRSGIYFLTREDENGFKYAYIGQAVNLIDRMCSHLTGYQHIDLSLKSHKFYSEENPYGWKLNFMHFPKNKLDEMEQKYIKEYALAGYQLRNKTSGSQGKGKAQINEYKPHKGYRDGLAQGYKNASKEISTLFEKYLKVSTKDEIPNRYQLNALEKFDAFLNYHKRENPNEEEN